MKEGCHIWSRKRTTTSRQGTGQQARERSRRATRRSDVWGRRQRTQQRKTTERLVRFLVSQDMVAANTLNSKHPTGLVTCRTPAARTFAPPFDVGPYQQIDFVLVQHRWKNAVQHVRNDIRAPLQSDHAPQVAQFRVRFKGEAPRRAPRPVRSASEEATEEKLERYNQLVRDALVGRDTARIVC